MAALEAEFCQQSGEGSGKWSGLLQSFYGCPGCGPEGLSHGQPGKEQEHLRVDLRGLWKMGPWTWGRWDEGSGGEGDVDTKLMFPDGGLRRDQILWWGTGWEEEQ